MMTKEKQRIGEKRKMHNGMDAEIIAYRSCHDVDVRFSDGYIVSGIPYSSFHYGQVKNPNVKLIRSTTVSQANCRLGETKQMNNGQFATIIAYRQADDIDIQFEDGTVVEHRQYKHFLSKKIRNPNVARKDFQQKLIDNAQARIGESNKMSCGMSATIIAYRRANDIDVQFEDGVIAEHRNYSSFQKGNISNPKIHPKIPAEAAQYRIGEKSIMKNGMSATLVEYRHALDVDFVLEDGELIEHRTYASFKAGTLPYAEPPDRTGEVRQMRSGELATIIEYNNSNDVSIEFEDGTIVKGKKYHHFINGYIRNPSRNPENSTLQTLRVGETRMMTCGLSAEIIEYRNALSVDVRFPDGAIVSDKAYASFLTGQIAHPSINRRNTASENQREYVDKERTMSNGQRATLTEYRGVYDIDVVFEDGTIIRHKTLSNFKNGNIGNPNSVRATVLTAASKHLGEKKQMRNGLYATIVRWDGHADIDVCFEDGTIVQNKSYDIFQKCQIAHPTYYPFSSLPERIIQGYLSKAQIPMVSEWTSPDLKGQKGRLRFDFAIVDDTKKPLAFIEYQGPQHYRPIERFGGLQQYERQVVHDQIKRDYAINCGVPLIEIPYWIDDIPNYLNSEIQSDESISFLLPNPIDSAEINVLDKRSTRLGETKLMSCGVEAQIIAYRNNSDIDVEFSDGAIIEHRTYSNFKAGSISNAPKRKKTI